MKAIVFIMCMWVGFAAQAAHVGQDSILLKIDKRNQTLIGLKNDKSRTLKEELTQVFEKKGLVLSDSLWQKIRLMIKSDSDRDSSISIQMGGQKIKIGAFRMGTKGEKANEFKRNQISKNNIIDVEKKNGEKVEIGLNGIHIQDGRDEVHVDWNGIRVMEGNGEDKKGIWERDTTKIKVGLVDFYSKERLNLYLGLNGLSGQVPQITTMVYPAIYMPTDPQLNPLGSRYVSLEISESAMLAKGKKAAFKLGYGLSFDWYNFMFDHSRVIQKANTGAIFQPIFDLNGKELSLSKNKLVVSYITMGIMPHVAFSKNSAIQMLGLGGYVSYRIDSWTKVIDAKTDQISRESSNFNLNQFRYGLRAEFACKKLPNLFFNYDLSTLFEKNSSPNLAGFSFGIRIL